MATIRALYANRWFRYSLSLLLLAIVVLKVRPQYLSVALQSAKPTDLAIALVLTLPFLAFKAWRWYLMLRFAGVEASFGEAATSLVGGMGLALVTPARLGELIRAAYIRDRQKWKIGALVMLDKAFDVLVLAGLSIVGAWALLGPGAGLVFLVVTILGLAVVYEPRLVNGLAVARRGGADRDGGPRGYPVPTTIRRAGREVVEQVDTAGAQGRSPRRAHRVVPTAEVGLKRGRFAEKLVEMWASLDALSPVATTMYLLLTLASFVVVLVQFAIILASWHPSSLAIVALTFPLVILTNVIPVTVGGLGIREAAAVLLLSRYGVPAAEAALAAFLMFAINTALPGLVGAVLLPPPSTTSSPSGVAALDRP